MYDHVGFMNGKWREGGDLNPRVLADNGLAIHRLAGLGHLRFPATKESGVIKAFVN